MKQFLGQVVNALAGRRSQSVQLSIGGLGLSKGRIETLHQGEVLTIVTDKGDRVLISVEAING